MKRLSYCIAGVALFTTSACGHQTGGGDPARTFSGTASVYVLARDNGRPDSLRIELIEMQDEAGGRLIAKIPSGRARVALGRVRRSGGEVSAVVQLPNRMTRLLVREASNGVEALLLAPDDTFRFLGTRSALSAAIADSLRTSLALRPFGAGIISTDSTGESFTTLTPDGTGMVFTRHVPDWSRHVLMESRHVNGAWTPAAALPFSGAFNDREPFIAPDGLSLWFSSNRPAPRDSARVTSQQIWVATRDALRSDWGTPRMLGNPVNVDAHDMSPSLTRDGTLYFSSRRASAIGRGDIFSALRRPNGDHHAPANLGPSINSITGEPNVFVSPDGTVMLHVAGERPDGLGLDDIYISRFVDGAWTPSRMLGPPVSSWDADYGPSLSPDGRYLYFTSHRRGTGDIYRVETARIPELGPPQSRR